MNSEHTLINEAVKMHRNDRVKNRKKTSDFFCYHAKKGQAEDWPLVPSLSKEWVF